MSVIAAILPVQGVPVCACGHQEAAHERQRGGRVFCEGCRYDESHDAEHAFTDGGYAPGPDRHLPAFGSLSFAGAR